MVDFSDEIGPKNAFFTLLQTKYSEILHNAQKHSMLICIPHSDTITNATLTHSFILHHILHPSPYLKSQFIAKVGKEVEEYYSIQNGEITNDNLAVPARIIYEEMGYDDNYNEYQTLVLDRPLDPKFGYTPLKNTTTTSITDALTQGEIEWKAMSTYDKAKDFLNGQIGNFNDHYTILIEFLDHAVSKIKEMSEQTMKKTFPLASNNKFDSTDITPIWIYIENYTLMKAYDKIFYVCCKRCKSKDHQLFKYMSSHQDITLEDLDVPTTFDFQYNAAKDRISELSTNHTPFAKLKCITDTLDLITSESQSLPTQEKQLYNVQDTPPITADILIPLFAYVLLRAQVSLLCANLFYLNSFSWHTLHLPKLSYAIVTFQASLQLILSHIGIELDDENSRETGEYFCEGTPYVSEKSLRHRGSLVQLGDTSTHPLDSNWRMASKDDSFEVVEELFYSQSKLPERKPIVTKKSSDWGFLNRFPKRHSIDGILSSSIEKKGPNRESSLGLDNVLALLTTKDK